MAKTFAKRVQNVDWVNHYRRHSNFTLNLMSPWQGENHSYYALRLQKKRNCNCPSPQIMTISDVSPGKSAVLLNAWQIPLSKEGTLVKVKIKLSYIRLILNNQQTNRKLKLFCKTNQMIITKWTRRKAQTKAGNQYFHLENWRLNLSLCPRFPKRLKKSLG